MNATEDANEGDFLDQAAEQTQSQSFEHVWKIFVAAVNSDPLINWNTNNDCDKGEVHWISHKRYHPGGRTLPQC